MRDYSFQEAGIEHAAQFLLHASPGTRQLYASPTGTGKSFMELRLQDRFPDLWIIVPRIEIGFDMLRKRAVEVSEASLYQHRICTPIVLRNRLLAGEWEAPGRLVIDEAHHHNAETYQLIDLLCGMCPAVGFTATPYRGTPKGTAKFRQAWGEPIWVITYPEALSLGVLSMPRCEIVPLVDDDIITVSNGEFDVRSIESATENRLEDAVNLLRPFFSSSWDRPTMVSLPSRDLARLFVRFAEGLPCVLVDGDTPTGERQKAFESVVACERLLVQIQVVSEGVDLPIRRMLDLHPMISPVEWLQSFGRITRPSDVAPHYLCTNRNLLRHAYLLEGCLPPEIVSQAEAAFGGPSKRMGARGVGMEALGRFAGAEVPLAGGMTGLCYSVSCVEGSTVKQYTCVVHPLKGDPLWAMRINQRTEDPMKPHYGKWSRCEPPQDLVGYASIPPAPITEKMSAWWKRDAAKRGLDPDVKVTRKNFTVLPVLTDLRVKL